MPISETSCLTSPLNPEPIAFNTNSEILIRPSFEIYLNSRFLTLFSIDKAYGGY